MDRGILCRHRRAEHVFWPCSCENSSRLRFPIIIISVSFCSAFSFFGGIAATSYRGNHITVDLVWANATPKYQRWIDVFATLVLLFVVTVQTYTLFDKVISTRAEGIVTMDSASADLAVFSGVVDR